MFLGLGLGGVNALGVVAPELPGVRDAVDFIAELRQAAHPSSVAVGRRVVVEGVENALQLALVREWGAEVVQGFLIAEALDSAALGKFASS